MQVSETPCAWTIAGSDSSGGAGIQADLKTFSSLRVWGCSIVTAVTAQGSDAVTGIWAVPPEAVAAQFEAVRNEFPPAACKTGMLAGRDTIEVVIRYIGQTIPLVVDPVMVSTSGRRLLDADAVKLFQDEIVPAAAIITPNLLEAALLAGLPQISSERDLETAGERIRDLGPRYVLIKGGHARSPDAMDILFSKTGCRTFTGVRYPYDPHGTGCCLSAAITAFLAKGCHMEDAVEQAKCFVDTAIQSAVRTRNGWLVNPG